MVFFGFISLSQHRTQKSICQGAAQRCYRCLWLYKRSAKMRICTIKFKKQMSSSNDILLPPPPIKLPPKGRSEGEPARQPMTRAMCPVRFYYITYHHRIQEKMSFLGVLRGSASINKTNTQAWLLSGPSQTKLFKKKMKTQGCKQGNPVLY